VAPLIKPYFPPSGGIGAGWGCSLTLDRKPFPDALVFIVGELLVPVYNAVGELRNVQTIH